MLSQRSVSAKSNRALAELADIDDKEYVQVLAALLNDGTSPNTGAQILKKHTVDEMFTNQIPNVRRIVQRQDASASKS